MEDQQPVAARGGVHRETLFTIALILARLFVLVLFLGEIRRGNLGGPDVLRFRALAHLGGTPWHDYPVEYAPLELLLIKGMFSVSLQSAATRLAVLALVADLAAWAGVRTGWGRRAGLFYLAAGLPVVILELQRVDLVPVAVATWAFVLARRARPGAAGAAGAALALAVLMKVWPLVLVPGLWLTARVRSLRSFVAVLATGVVGWIVWGGLGAPSQVLTFRGAMGWEAGSTVGSLIWVIGGGPVREEAGAARVGTAPGWAKVVLGLALLAVLMCVWLRAVRWSEEAAGKPALTAVAALLLLSPLFSAQYVFWLLPWAAVAAVDDEHPMLPLAGTFLICVASSLIAEFLYNGAFDAVVKIASLVRVTLLTMLVIRGLTSREPRTRAAPGLSAGG